MYANENVLQTINVGQMKMNKLTIVIMQQYSYES